jgi:hypothetical protein
VLSETSTREVALPLRRAFIAALTLALLTAALAAGPATAAKRAGTTVVISLKLPAFHGTLGSANAACKSGRRVHLFKVKGGPDKLLKSATSNGKGKWTTKVGSGNKIPSGSYYVKAAARGNCKAGKSKRLVIPG